MIDFTMPDHLVPVPQTWKQGRVQSSPLNRSKGRIVMKTLPPCARAGRELQRRDLTARERRQALEKPAGGSPASSAVPLFRAECLRPTTSFQRRLSGGVETDPEGFIRPSYNATGGASKAMRRGNFHRWDTNETLAVHLNRETLKHQIIYMQPTP